MGLTLLEVLVRALKKLGKSSLERFIKKLRVWEVKEEYTEIPKDELRGKDPEHIAGLIYRYYRDGYGAEVTLEILEDINEEKVWEELRQDLMEVDTRRRGPGTTMSKTGDHFIDRHREELIHRIKIVDPVIENLYDIDLLRMEERANIRRPGDSEEKMRRLYEIIRNWGYCYKDEVYRSFYKYNPHIINDLIMQEGESPLEEGRGATFIDDHQSDLIRGITDVDPVLHDLQDQKLLTQEEYDEVMEKPTNQGKMTELCDVIYHWEDAGKYKAYITLRKLNGPLIKDLEMKDKVWKEAELRHPRAKDHFIDRHREDLINGITHVDQVIHDLYCKDLMRMRQYDYIRRIKQPEEMMRHLYETIRNWGYWCKEEVYRSFYKYNHQIIDDLKMKEDRSRIEEAGGDFIYKHRDELIHRIKTVDPVVDELYCKDMLTKDEHDDIRRLSNSEDKMRRLYVAIRDRHGCAKEVYHTLYKHNQSVLDEILDDLTKSKETTGVHFIYRHREDLINRIKTVDPVVDDLYRKDLLTKDVRDDIRRLPNPEDKMRSLYVAICNRSVLRHHAFIRDPDYWDKEVYRTLYKHNPSVLDEILDDLTKSNKKEASQKSDEPQMSAAWMAVDNLNCKLCGKEGDSAEVVSTNGSVYRLELKSPGLYRCQKTGIKFLVNRAVIIEYIMDSWSDHLRDIADHNYQILGPLFNITVYGEPNVVAAVYLPHFLCLESFTGDISNIKCAHFTAGNMILVTPTQIDPFYITLENPTFSCMGPLLSFRRKIPIHGTVLIYFTILCQGDPEEEHRIHLYVLPYCRSAEETLDKKNEKFGYRRIIKPEHTVDPVYSKVKYHVTGRPGVSVHPKTLKFQSEPYQFTEIRLMEKNTDIFLSVAQEISDGPVWDAHLSTSDIRNIIQLLPRPTVHEEKLQDLSSATQRLSLQEGACGASQHHSKHFLDRHLGDLTRLITMVDPVLDELLSKGLISDEQYHKVRKETTTEDKIRKLYEFIRSLGDVDKDKVITALRRHNPSSRVWKSL